MSNTGLDVTKWREVLRRAKGALVRKGRTEQDAEDLVQEAWLRLACYGKASAVVEPEAFLMRAALNLSIDAYRAQRSRGEEVLLEDVVLLDPMPGIEAVLLGRERLARFGVCLPRLNCRTREIFIAHRIDGMTYQEIARRHDLSITAVEKHVAKATLLLTGWMEGW